ncbi:MAG: hypothetical protein U0R80_03140 [Nocardioidaceae bacterium]
MLSRRLVSVAAALAAALPLGVAQPAPAAPAVARGARVTAADPAGSSTGHWRVVKVAADSWLVSWRSPSRLPVTSDRPVVESAGTPLGTARVSADGRTVSVEVHARRAPEVAGLHVLLSGDRLDVAGDDVHADRAGGPAARFTPPDAVTLPEDPAEPGAFAVQSDDYELDPVKLPGMPEPIEMVGHVVEPVDSAVTGPRPLVLFLHGRHSYCYEPGTDNDGFEWPCQAPFEEIPSHLGYDYIQQVLASQGYATVSIRVNGINAQDWKLADGGANARAAIVERHLDYWTTIAGDHQVDLSRVVLVGHSRGGEGVDRASLEIPLSAPYRIAGQVLLAPTDFATQTAAYVPTVTMLPYCDGDVFDLQGQRFTDTARDLTRDDTSLKSSVLVMGANHNFFNTEWTPGIAQAPAWDDWGDSGGGLCDSSDPGRLSAAEQRDVGVAYVAGAVHLFTRDEQQFLPMYDGTAARVASTGDAVVLSHAIGGGRELRRPGIDAGLALADGADTQLCTGAYTWGTPTHALCGRFGDLDGNVPHWPEAGEFTPKRPDLEMSWTAIGQRGGLAFDDPLDLSGGRRLELRTVVDPTVGDAAFQVRVVDDTGASALLTPDGGTTVPALPLKEFLGKRWAQSVLVDPSAAGGVDLAHIVEVDLVSVNDAGRVWVLDAASAPASLASVPDKRLAQVNLGTIEVPEGDEAAATARVPFTVSGDLDRRASFVVGLLSFDGSFDATTVDVDLAPGQTQGSVVVDYRGNRLDDAAKSRTQLVAFPRSGVMTDDYFGELAVLDDDPTPEVRVQAVHRNVREGEPAQIKVSLASRVGYFVEIQLDVVRGTGKGPRLSVGDVPRRWLRLHGVPPTVADGRPLHRTTVSNFGFLDAGSRSLVLSMPTLDDGRREPQEQVSFRVRMRMADGTIRVVKPVYVTD